MASAFCCRYECFGLVVVLVVGVGTVSVNVNVDVGGGGVAAGGVVASVEGVVEAEVA